MNTTIVGYRIASDTFISIQELLEKDCLQEYIAFEEAVLDTASKQIKIGYPGWCWCTNNTGVLKGVIRLQCIYFIEYNTYRWYDCEQLTIKDGKCGKIVSDIESACR